MKACGWSFILKIISHFWQFLCLIIKRFRQDGCTHRAASLAFTTLLSLVPLMTVSFTLLTIFPVFQKFAQNIQDFVFQNFVATSAQVVQKHLQAFIHQASHLSAVGTMFLLATAVLMVFNMEQTFNTIWHVKRQRSFVAAFLVYWAVLTLAPLLVGVALLISTYFISLPYISTAAQVLGLKKIVLLATPYLSTFIAFTLLYLTLPNCKVRLRYALIGGIVASILFEIVKQAFILYITKYSVYQLLYGALATMPIFLVWIYLCWLIILFGAVISATLGERKTFK